jgi:GNAT superfamily N-acetyltransferase
VESLDCPELTGLRPIAEVLAGHRATGLFDSSLWWVARRGEEPVGVMLLNRIPDVEALEVVYMGVAQAARGTGVADGLLDQAVAAAKQAGASTLALAVDQRNTPARRLYTRWGFTETGARDAWIATSVPTRA